jgi:CRP-like cAMP-binding protein
MRRTKAGYYLLAFLVVLPCVGCWVFKDFLPGATGLYLAEWEVKLSGYYTYALPDSASLVVDEDGVVYRLSSEALRRMESEDQALGTAFHKFIAHVLAERLADTTEALDVALR